MFITLEDETANANLIVWPSVFDQNRARSSGLPCWAAGVRCNAAYNVIHLVVEQVRDLTADLKMVSGLDAPFPLAPGRGDEAKRGGSAPDSRPIARPRDMYEPDLHIDTLKLKARNFW